MSLIAVVTTLADPQSARRIARALVERRLAACVQLSAIESVYFWDGALRQEPEWRVVAKTTGDRWPAVEAAIRDLHDDELPAIWALPVEHAEPRYAEWVARESGSAAAAPSGRPA